MSGCLEAYIYSLFIVWGAGGKHHQGKKVKIAICIYLYLYLYLHIKWPLSLFSLPPQICSLLPTRTSQASQGRQFKIFLILMIHFSKKREHLKFTPEISASSSWFESRKLWAQHMIAPEKQMVSWLTTQFMGCNCLVVRKIIQQHLESV